MSSRRVQKVAQAIREVVSMAILAELKDPRVQDVTVTYVEVSGDLRHAKVHVSVMGDEKKQRLTLQGLKSAAGFLQSRCARRIETRYTPRIEFVLDQGVKKSIEIAQILDRVLPHQDVSPAPALESDGALVDEAEIDEDGSVPLGGNQPTPDEPRHAPQRQPPAS
jgi:ribosome-binding factor A